MLLGTMEDYGTSGTTTSPTVNYGIGNGTTEILVFPDAVLHCIMRYVFLWLHDPINTHGRENIVFWIKRASIMSGLKILDPQSQPVEGITCRQLGLGK